MEWVLLIAGVSLYLYGLRLMSGGVQKGCGSFLRGILMVEHGGRLQRFFSGAMLSLFMFSTAGSAGAVVGLVNSGLYKAHRAYDAIVGVNLGGIVTMWLLTVLGFSLPYSSVQICAGGLVALSLSLMLFRDSYIRYFGELGMGVGLVLFGIGLFHLQMGTLLGAPWVEPLFDWFSDGGFLPALVILLTGFALSLFLSSSVGAFVVAVSLYFHGLFTPLQVAWLVVGVNLGSALAVYLGSLKGNQPARRMGAWHLVFNLYGLFWFLLLALYLWGLESRIWASLITPGRGFLAMVYFVPLVHTALNGGSLVQLLLLRRFLNRLIGWLGIGDGLAQNEVFHLRAFTMGLHPTGEIALLQAQEMTLKYARRTYRMFGFTRSLFEPTYKDLAPIIARVEKYGRISTRVEGEIASFLGDMRWGDLSERGRRQLGALLRVSVSIESLAISTEAIATVVKRKEQEELWFNEYVVGRVEMLFQLIDEDFGYMELLLSGTQGDEEHAQAIAATLEKICRIRDEHQARWETDLELAAYTGGAGVLLTEIIGECERMGRAFVQIAKVLQGVVLQTHGGFRWPIVQGRTGEHSRVGIGLIHGTRG